MSVFESHRYRKYVQKDYSLDDSIYRGLGIMYNFCHVDLLEKFMFYGTKKNILEFINLNRNLISLMAEKNLQIKIMVEERRFPYLELLDVIEKCLINDITTTTKEIDKYDLKEILRYFSKYVFPAVCSEDFAKKTVAENTGLTVNDVINHQSTEFRKCYMGLNEAYFKLARIAKQRLDIEESAKTLGTKKNRTQQ